MRTQTESASTRLTCGSSAAAARTPARAPRASAALNHEYGRPLIDTNTCSHGRLTDGCRGRPQIEGTEAGRLGATGEAGAPDTRRRRGTWSARPPTLFVATDLTRPVGPRSRLGSPLS